jgi:hypothetical protein
MYGRWCSGSEASVLSTHRSDSSFTPGQFRARMRATTPTQPMVTKGRLYGSAHRDSWDRDLCLAT